MRPLSHICAVSPSRGFGILATHLTAPLAHRYCALFALAVAAAAAALAWNVLRQRHGWTPSALRRRVEPYLRRALVGCKASALLVFRKMAHAP